MASAFPEPTSRRLIVCRFGPFNLGGRILSPCPGLCSYPHTRGILEGSGDPLPPAQTLRTRRRQRCFPHPADRCAVAERGRPGAVRHRGAESAAALRGPGAPPSGPAGNLPAPSRARLRTRARSCARSAPPGLRRCDRSALAEPAPEPEERCRPTQLLCTLAPLLVLVLFFICFVFPRELQSTFKC